MILKFYVGLLVGLLAWCIIAMASCSYQSHRAEKLQTVINQKNAAITAAITAANAEAKAEATAIEQRYTQKLLEVEQNAAQQIQNAHRANAATADAARRLSKQIADTNKHLPQATRQTAVDYAVTAGELLQDCTDKYRTLAASADQHIIDVKRLNNAWPSE